jgi:menaquinone-dependent protoporphyrinogen IX oxidase
MKTLVVYDTKHGSTEEVAMRISGEIRKRGGAAELLDLRKKEAAKISLDGFSMVALGGPFYMGRWSKRASAFAAAHEAELALKTLALFSLGTNDALGEAAARAALPPSLAAKALSAHFGGRVDFDRLGGFERFIVKAVSGKGESISTIDFDSAAVFVERLWEGNER